MAEAVSPVATFVLTAALGLGCGSGSGLTPVPDPPNGYAYAYASPDCAPWDGRAVEIVLTTTPTNTPDSAQSRLRLAIYPREAEIADKSYRWPADPEMATGARCTADSCEVAARGEIELRSARPDSSLDGTVVLRFGSNDVVSGGFRAVWRPRRIMCG
jgi:hypothetical protein